MSVRPNGWTAVCDDCGSDFGDTQSTREEAEQFAATYGSTCATCEEIP